MFNFLGTIPVMASFSLPSILVHTIEGVFSPELCCHGDCCVDTVELCKAAEEGGYSSFLGSCLVALVKKSLTRGFGCDYRAAVTSD